MAAELLAGAALQGLMGSIAQDSARREADRQYRLTKEFAQMGIRWRVADAKAAGIHPALALGASIPGYSGSSYVGESGIESALAAMGQDLLRSKMATSSQQEREDLGAFALRKERESDLRVKQQQAWDLNVIDKQHQIQGHALRNDNLMLENELLRQRVRSASGQVGPGLPLEGAVKVVPSEQISSDPSVPGREAFKGEGKPAFVPYRIGTKDFGFTMDVPSSEFGEGLEGGGPAAWLLGAAGIGGHYGSKFLQWAHDRDLLRGKSAREIQALQYRWLQDRGVYPRRRGM